MYSSLTTSRLCQCFRFVDDTSFELFFSSLRTTCPPIPFLIFELEIVRAITSMKLYSSSFFQPPVAFSLSGQNECQQLARQTLGSYSSRHVRDKVPQQCKGPLIFRRHLLLLLSGLSQNVKIGGCFENQQLCKRHRISCNPQKIKFSMCLMNGFSSYFCAAVRRVCFLLFCW